MIPRATIDDLLSWRPCPDYPARRIRELAGDAISFTALGVLRREDIPTKNRLWVVLRPEMLGALFVPAACDIAAHVLPVYEAAYPNDMRPRRCITIVRRFVAGEATSTELVSARDAARAARDAARAAARYAPGDEWYAAGAVWYAAGKSAWCAARAARDAMGAARDAETRWQVQHLIEMLEREE